MPLIEHLVSTETSDASSDISSSSTADKGDAFTRANVFGLYLTISFCLLVQPYGSLLYARPRSRPGRAAFYFWRLNPIACLAEAMLLWIGVASGLYESLKGPWKAVLRPKYLWNEICRATTTIRILRAVGTPATPDVLKEALEPDQTAADENITSIMQDTTLAKRILNFIATVGIIIQVVKLCAITIPLHVHLPAIFMLTGWIHIQLLYLVPARTQRTSDHEDNRNNADIIQQTLSMDRILMSFPLWALFTFLLTPFCAYILYLEGTGRTKPLAGPVMNAFVAYAGMWCGTCLSLSLPVLWSRARQILFYQFTSSPSFSLAVSISLFIMYAAFWIMVFIAEAHKRFEMEWVDSNILVWAMGSMAVMWVLWSWCLIPGAPCMRRKGWQYEVVRVSAMASNIVVSVLVLVAALEVYDVEGTRKPGWVEWLG